jgi:alpha,alpha-trehalase
MNMNNSNYKAVILDMDGVVTDTASLHFRAWKAMFDEFLQRRSQEDVRPLDENDYKMYLDGVGRFEGIRRFLDSRNMSIPEGTKDDDYQKNTIYGLGKRKNQKFHKLLDESGVKVYHDAREMIAGWKRLDIPVALISASRNCKRVLKSADLLNAFDAIVDGETAAKRDLKAKPKPDIFIEAARQLKQKPADVMIVEDAVAGVEAGVNGKFGRVAGIARNTDDAMLKKAGADVVVNSLSDLSEVLNWPANLPEVLTETAKIKDSLQNTHPFLCLDYDGTLTPIVSDPADAKLSKSGRKILTGLSKKIKLAIISGRDRADLKSLVQIDTVYYAGSHGFDITGPDNLQLEYGPGKKVRPQLEAAAAKLEKQLKNINGAMVEHKKYAIAVHYRNVDENERKLVMDAVAEEVKNHSGLKISEGKMIRELKPDIDWNKGRALSWLQNEIMHSDDKLTPIYIGDDVTDEDALAEVSMKGGIGIIVGQPDRITAAGYRLEDTDQVFDFLEWLNGYMTS